MWLSLPLENHSISGSENCSRHQWNIGAKKPTLSQPFLNTSIIPYLNMPSPLWWIFVPWHRAKICLLIVSIYCFNSGFFEIKGWGNVKLFFHMATFIYMKSSLTHLLQLFLTSQILSLFIILGTHIRLRTSASFFSVSLAWYLINVLL